MKIKSWKWGLCVSLAVMMAATASAQTPPAADPAAAPAQTPVENPPQVATESQAPAAPTPTGKPSREDIAACIFRPQEITPIREPQYGMPNVWDTLYAGDGMEVFSDILPLDGPAYVVGGAYTKDEKDKIYHPLLVKFDDRMKPVWERRLESKESKTITRVLKTKDGFVVLGDVTEKGAGGVYVEFYDEDGKSKGAKTYFEHGGELDGKAIVAAGDGSGYLVAVQFIDAKDKANQYGMIYKLSRAGSPLWKRAYQPGRSTVFQNIQQGLDGNYLVSGQIVMEETKSGGWLINVDGAGKIRWQQTYPRGNAASILSTVPMKDGDYILSGKIRPLGEMMGANTLAAWIARLSPNGTVLWERYFKSPYYDYEALDAIVYEDGRASVLVKGMGMDTYHRAHARFMTMSPAGIIMSSEDYTDGQNAAVRRLVSGLAGERIIAGYAQTGFGKDGKTDGPAPEYTYDGWLMAAPPLDTYNDPCAVSPAGSPILE